MFSKVVQVLTLTAANSLSYFVNLSKLYNSFYKEMF